MNISLYFKWIRRLDTPNPRIDSKITKDYYNKKFAIANSRRLKMLLSTLLVCSSLLGRSYSSLGIDHLDYLKEHGFSDEDIRLMDESTVNAIRNSKSLSAYTVTYPQEDDPSSSDISTLSDDTSADFKDNYITINLLVSEVSKAKYHFYATSKWDKMPFCRGTDSFSICADGVVPVYSTVFSYVTDICKVSVSNKNHVSVQTKNENHPISSDKITMAADDRTNGTGFLYDLPNNKVIVQTEYKYTDVQFHLSFDASLQYPNQSQNFNVYAIHDHLERNIQGSVSLTFSAKNGCFGLGLNSSWMMHRRYAVTQNPIYYEA